MGTPNLTDWIQAISAMVTAIASVLLVAAIYYTRKHIRLTEEEIKSVDRWNRITATFTFFSTNTLAEPQAKAAATLREIGIDLQRQATPLTQDQISKLVENHDAFADVKQYLNTLEDYAVAVTCGALDEDTAYRMMSHIVARHFRIFKPVFDLRRKESGDEAVYSEIERLALRWQRKAPRGLPPNPPGTA